MPFPRLGFTSTLGRRIRGRPTERFESFVKTLLVGVLFRFPIMKADKENYNIPAFIIHFRRCYNMRSNFLNFSVLKLAERWGICMIFLSF